MRIVLRKCSQAFVWYQTWEIKLSHTIFLILLFMSGFALRRAFPPLVCACLFELGLHVTVSFLRDEWVQYIVECENTPTYARTLSMGMLHNGSLVMSCGCFSLSIQKLPAGAPVSNPTYGSILCSPGTFNAFAYPSRREKQSSSQSRTVSFNHNLVRRIQF